MGSTQRWIEFTPRCSRTWAPLGSNFRFGQLKEKGPDFNPDPLIKTSYTALMIRLRHEGQICLWSQLYSCLVLDPTS